MRLRIDIKEVLIYGALAGAIFIFLLVFPFGIAFLGAANGPLILLARKKSLSETFLAALLAIFISVILGLNALFLSVFYFLIMGMVMSFLVNRNHILPSLIVGFLIVTCFLFFIGGYDYLTSKKEYIKEQQQILEDALREQADIYQQLGLEQSEIDELISNIKKSIPLIISLMPAALTLNAFLNSFFALLIGAWLWKIKNKDEPLLLPKFSSWYLPWPLVYVFIIGFALFLFKSSFGVYENYANIIGLNLLLFSIPFYIVLGLSIIWFFIEKLKFGAVVKFFLFLFMLFFPFILFVIILIGIFDTWFDWRKLSKKL